MAKITLKDITDTYKELTSLELLKDRGYEKDDNRKAEKQMFDSMELELAISKLKPKQQQIVRLIGEGYTHREIAQMLNVGRVSVRRTLDRIRDMMS